MGQNVNEVLKTSTKLALSTVPVIGTMAINICETLENIAAKKEMERLKDSIEVIFEKLNELELNTPLQIPYLGEELLFDILKHTKTIYTDFKRTCLANLIKNLTFEVSKNTFEHSTYRIVFDQFSKLQDPELELLFAIHKNKNSVVYKKYLVSKIKLLELSNSSEYCIVQLVNTGILIENNGFVSSHPDAMKGEYTLTSEAKTLANKLFEDCTMLTNA